MRYGENAKDVIDRVKAKIKDLEKGLPPGVKIVAAYDRSDLISRAIDTLKTALTEEAIVVSLVVLLFLLHFRSASGHRHYLAGCGAHCLHYHEADGGDLQHHVAWGDCHCHRCAGGCRGHHGGERYRHLSELPPEEREQKRLEVVISSAKQVGRAIFFSVAIIVLSFVPVFLLEGQEGKLFHPLAFTKTFSMMGSAFIAITLVPVLMYYLMRGKMPPESKNPVSTFFIKLTLPYIRWVLRKKTTIALNVLALADGNPDVYFARQRVHAPAGRGFLALMPVTLPNVSVNEAKAADTAAG